MAFKTGEAGNNAGGSANLMGSAGRDPLASGVSTHNVVFAIPKATSNYEPFCSFLNVADTDPIFLQYYCNNIGVNGFTVVFNAPTDSSNYILCWSAIDDA